MKRRYIACLLSMAFCTASYGAVVDFGTTMVDNTSQLTGYVTQDLKVTGTGQLTGVQILLNLTAGSIYQDSFGAELAPGSNFFGLVPSLEFDTYVGLGDTTSDGAGYRPTIIAGGAVDLGGAPTMSFGDAALDIAYAPGGGIVITDPTDYQVARLTLSDDAAGTAVILGATFQEDSLVTPELAIVDGVLMFPAENGLEGMYNGPGTSLSEGLQGAFADRNFGPILLDDAIMLSNIGGDLSALDPLSASIIFSTGNATGTVEDLDGDGKYDIMIDADFASLAPGTKIAGEVLFGTGADADPNAVGFGFSVTVPEPSTFAIAGLALVGLVGFARRK